VTKKEKVFAYAKRVLNARRVGKFHFRKGPFFVQYFFGPGKKYWSGLQGEKLHALMTVGQCGKKSILFDTLIV
jgi:hypothetical protein